MTRSRFHIRPSVVPLDDRIVPAGGLPDGSFGSNGVAVLPPSQATANAVAVQPDGKVVIAGGVGLQKGIFVTRVNADGAADPTFGSGGVVRLPVGAGEFASESANAVAVQPDGRIVVAGFRTGRDVAVTRLNPDGSPDASFGVGGDAAIEVGPSENGFDRAFTANALTVLADGRLLLAGALDGDFAAVRLTATGAADPTFGAGGWSVFGFDDLEAGAPLTAGRFDAAAAIAVQPDGRIVLAGSSTHVQTQKFDFPGAVMAVARLTADGLLDPTFDGDGRQTIDFAGEGGIDRAAAVAVQPDGRIVVAGLAGYYTFFLQFDPNADMAVARLNADGSFDPGFDGDGKRTVVFGPETLPRDSRAVVVQVTAAGKILLGGSAAEATTDDPPVRRERTPATARLNADGSLDASYGTDGRAVVPNPADRQPTAAILAGTTQHPGRLLLAGVTDYDPSPAGPGTGDPLLVRVVTDEATTGAVLVGGRPDGTAVALNPTDGQLSPATTYPFFPGFSGTVRTATADVTGDGVPDFIGGAGPLGGPNVVVFDGKTGARIADFDAFETSFRGGVYVAAADIDGDGKAEVVVTPDQGGGPVVAVYSGAGLTAGQSEAAQLARFFGIEDANFRGGARPALGDIDGDGRADLVVAAGFSGGPRVAIFGGATLFSPVLAGVLPPKLVTDFFAFEETLRNGVFVAAGDVTGDGKADVAFGGGPDGGPRVRLFGGTELLARVPLTTLDEISASRVADFFAGDPAGRGGVRLALRDVDADGLADLVAGSGDAGPSRMRVYRAATLRTTADPAFDQELDPFNVTIPDVRPLAEGVYVG